MNKYLVYIHFIRNGTFTLNIVAKDIVEAHNKVFKYLQEHNYHEYEILDLCINRK